jgi:uncharacterized membrane protein
VQRFDFHTRWWVAVAALLAAVYCGGFVVAPLLEHHGLAAGSWLRLGYAPACHQQPDRCLDLGAGQLAVCARCAGLYAGGLLGLLFGAVTGIRVRPSLRWLLLASAPSVLDFAAAQLGLPSLANWPRFAVAVAPGLAAGLLLADAIADIATHVGPPTQGAAKNPLQ